MGRRLTLDEYLKAFTDGETESVQEAISVRVSDAEVYSLGRLFIQLMGGVAQCLRSPPKRRRRRRQGYSGIKRFLLGSVALSVGSHAPCSVEVVRRKEKT